MPEDAGQKPRRGLTPALVVPCSVLQTPWRGAEKALALLWVLGRRTDTAPRASRVGSCLSGEGGGVCTCGGVQRRVVLPAEQREALPLFWVGLGAF